MSRSSEEGWVHLSQSSSSQGSNMSSPLGFAVENWVQVKNAVVPNKISAVGVADFSQCTNGSKMSSFEEKLKAEISTKADHIRKMKEGGESKMSILMEVKNLLSLAEKYKEITGSCIPKSLVKRTC